jgi:hypothetical protein
VEVDVFEDVRCPPDSLLNSGRFRNPDHNGTADSVNFSRQSFDIYVNFLSKSANSPVVQGLMEGLRPRLWPGEESSMRYGISVLALLLAVSIAAAPAWAQGRGKGQANHPTTTGAKAGGAKTDHPKPATAKGPKSTTTTTTTTSHGNGPKAKTQTADVGGKAKGNPHRTTTTNTTVVSNVTPTTPTTVHVKNPKLEARLLGLLGLPADTPITDVSSGFKNWGQFVAAVHVSENLGLDFNTLKAAMTGIPAGSPAGTAPTTQPMSLGQAIQSLGGSTLEGTTVETEVKKADAEANEDFRRTRERS